MGSLVSSVDDLFGGAQNNAGFTAQAAPLIQPVSSGQVTNAENIGAGAVNQQQALVQALNAQGAEGANTQSNLTSALTNQANGIGPNPAQAALAQSTGQNINQQAALGAGQRGASSNVGLIARENAQQGAGIQQNAVGQAATLQAQQQLSAEQQLQNLAGTQVGQQSNALTNLNNSALTNQGQLLGALGNYNSNLVGSTTSKNSTNASVANNNANNTSSAIGGLFQGAAAAAAFAAKGGEIESDGSIDAKGVLAKALSKKIMPDHLKEMAAIHHPKVLKMCSGGAIPMSEGAVVPGEPKVPGKNTLKNDVVPAMLTPKEIVLPLSVTQAKDPGAAAKAFVEHIKGKDSGESNDSDFKQALRKHMANRKSKKA